jgi:hypothetical protein
VLEEFLKGDALHRLALQQQPQQALAGSAQPASHSLWQASLPALYVAQQLHVVGTIEGRLAYQQLV